MSGSKTRLVSSAAPCRRHSACWPSWRSQSSLKLGSLTTASSGLAEDNAGKPLFVEAGIERVSQAIADQADGEHGDEDQESGDEDIRPGASEILARVFQHVAPGGSRNLDAKPEEAQRRLQ